MPIKMKEMTNLFILLILVAGVGFFYKRYNDKIEREERDENYEAIQKYLLNEGDLDELGKNKNPIIWIHIKYEYNARNWLSFGSRSSFCLNQPYLYLTVRSIIQQCSNDFRICIIDDQSFSKLLPGWSIDTTRISYPIIGYVREMALARIVHKYGGMVVPPSFLCMRNLSELYNYNTQNGKMFIVENIDRNITSTTNMFYPSLKFFGSNEKENPVLADLIDFMQRTISYDYTDQTKFQGEFDRWVASKVQKNEVNIVDGKLIGVKTAKYSEPILIDDLLSNSYIDLYDKTFGIYIPADEVLKRRHYEWFSRLSVEQVLESKIIISKYMLLCMIPDSKKGRIEAMQGKKNKWVHFWSTPLLPQSKYNVGENSGLYMVTQPNMLGDNIPIISNNNFLQGVNTF
jgi:hypothetical protein